MGQRYIAKGWIMNIEIYYTKEGASTIPIIVSLRDATSTSIYFKKIYSIQQNTGCIKFFCDWPFSTNINLDFTTEDKNVEFDYFTITKFIFDDFWESVDLTMKGTILLNKDSNQIVTSSCDYNSLYYTGTLRYSIPRRPMTNWTTKL